MKFKNVLLQVLIVSTLIFTGCSTPSSTPESETTKETLTIGVMPAVDTAPIFLAEEKGFFEALGLDLNIQIFNNAQDRQTALQTHAIDGALTDLIAVATNVDGGFNLKATTLTDGVFPVLVREGYEETPDIKVGMMEVSVSNFLIDEWLGADYNIEKVFINDIPGRLEMIKNGNIDMGLFPEPMASNGALNGLEKRIYTPEDGLCPNVMAFTDKALTSKTEALVRFHEGYNQGVAYANEHPDEARSLLIEKLQLNPAIKDLFILPTYSNAHLPDDTYLEKIIGWVQTELKQDLSATPDELIYEGFLN